jgi:DNA-binding NarL/FixJ family response regulator
VLKLLALGSNVKEIVAELAMPPDMVRGHVQSILVKLGVHSRLDPPPLPPAASAALAVPRQRAEDVPTRVGKPLRQESGPPQQSA